MKPVQWFLLALAGLVLLAYVRRRQLGVAPARAGDTPPPAGGGGLPDPNAPTHGAGTAPQGGTGKTPGTSGNAYRDVAPADLETGDERLIDVILDDAYAHITDGAPSAADANYWNERFNRQFLQPAQALTAADLTQEHFDLAFKMLYGALTPPTDRSLMTDRQRKQADLTASDSTAETLYGVWKTVANIAGSFTFGLTALAANLIDSQVGSDGKTITQELADSGAVNKLIVRNLNGTQVIELIKWLGPPSLIQGTQPSEWTPTMMQKAFAFVTGQSSDGDIGAPRALQPFDHFTSPAGVVPVYSRQQLFAGGRGGFYLLWNAMELVQGLDLRGRINKRARVFRALDIIACQLFPFTTPMVTPVNQAPAEPPGVYAWWNGNYKGSDGTASGWIKGSIFRPVAGDWTYAAIMAVRRAETGALNLPPPPRSPASVPGLTGLSGTVGNPTPPPIPTGATVGLLLGALPPPPPPPPPLPLGGLGWLLGAG